jgi:hypothetical protein
MGPGHPTDGPGLQTGVPHQHWGGHHRLLLWWLLVMLLLMRVV